MTTLNFPSCGIVCDLSYIKVCMLFKSSLSFQTNKSGAFETMSQERQTPPKKLFTFSLFIQSVNS